MKKTVHNSSMKFINYTRGKYGWMRDTNRILYWQRPPSVQFHITRMWNNDDSNTK